MAALTCPPDLRIWIWCKLAHFEKLGQYCFDLVKENLAVLWDMPEILRDGFSPVSGDSPQRETRISSDDTNDTVGLKVVPLPDDGDDNLESLRQLRGLFGLLEI